MAMEYRIHYIYKIHFLCGYPTGRYYLGKHTGYISDSYTGSGQFCFAYFKKYGKIEGETYIKEIIEINPSKDVNRDREIIVIGDKWKTDPLCMNQAPGGWAKPIGCGDHKNVSVRQYDLNGNFIKEYSSIELAKDETGICDISACCNRKLKTSGGYIWRYAKENLYKVDPNEIRNNRYKRIIQYDLDGNKIAEYDQIKFAAELLGIDPRRIGECLSRRHNSTSGYQWRYSTEPSPGKLVLGMGYTSPVIRCDLNWNELERYDSVSSASKDINVSSKSITAACKSKGTCAGYKWKLEDSNRKNKTIFKSKKNRNIVQYSKTGEFIAEYNDIYDAVEKLNLNSADTIYDAIIKQNKTAYGYKWKFKD